MSQQDALKDSEVTSDKHDDSLFCITDYNPSGPDIKKLTSDLWPIMNRSSSTHSLLDTTIVYGYGKPKNISDLIIRSDSMIREKAAKRPPKCNCFPKCSHCPLINKTGQIQSTSAGRKYKALKNVTCSTKNLIYCMQCQKCNIQYVGQTKLKLLNWINQHRYCIRNKLDTPVSRHLNGHYMVTALQIIHEDNAELRNVWEEKWMARLYTYVPKGLNIQD